MKIPHLLLALVLFAAPAAAQNQPLKEDSVLAARIRKSITASPLPQNLKDEFEKRVTDGMNPKWSHQTRYNILDKAESDFNNNVSTYKSALDMIDYVQKTPGATQKMRDDYTARINGQIKAYLPNNYSQMHQQVANVKSDFGENLRLIGLIRAFQAKTKTDKGPPIAAQQFVDGTNGIIARMGNSNIVGDFTSFQTYETHYRQHMDLVADFDGINAKVQSDGRANTVFKQNTAAELQKMRLDIGRAPAGIGRTNVDYMKTQVERRLVMLKQIMVSATWVAKVPILDSRRAALNSRLERQLYLVSTWGLSESSSLDLIRDIQVDAERIVR